jgi:hypothetical protein
MEKASTMKTCYYELLEVEKTATQKDIEKVTPNSLNPYPGLQESGPKVAPGQEPGCRHDLEVLGHQ